MQLLEREGEVAQLHEAVRDAAEGRGSIVLVAGEAGIGKSSLVTAWTAYPGADAWVLLGWCDDFLTSRTLGPLHDVARSAGGPLADAVARADTGAVLDALLAELSNALRPTLLVLEDVHWADEATLDVIRYVGRRIVGLPAVLALTYRDDEIGADHPLQGVLGALPHAAVRRVRPHGLSRAAIAQLTAGTDLDPDAVLESTAGNPFFVTEVLQSRGGIPASVTDAVLARLRLLGDEARRAVELLSVMPRPPLRDELDGLLGGPAATAPAEERGMLTLQAGRIGFRHELARRAVLESLPASLRIAHHRAVLDHLERAGGDSTALLHHAVECGRADVVAAIGPQVAREAFRAGAHRQAVGHQKQVLAYANLLEPDEHARLLEEHAWSLYNLHRFDDALQATARAAELREHLGDLAARIRSELLRSRMLYMTNRLDDAFNVLAVAARLGEDRDDPQIAAETAAQRVSLLHLADRHHEVAAESEAAVKLARRLDRLDLVVQCEQYAAASAVLLGDSDAGLARMRAALDLGRRTGQLEPTARTYTNFVEHLLIARRWDEMRETIEAAIAFYDDYDFRAHRYNTLGQRGRMALYTGEWAEAWRILRDVGASVRGAGVLEAIPLEALALLAVRSGAGDADALVDRAWGVALRTQSAQYIVPAACAGIEWAWTAERPEAAERFTAAAIDAAGDSALLAWIRWRLPLVGQPADADAVWMEPERLSLAGDWEAAAGRWAEAQMPYEQALELLRSRMVEPTLAALAILDRLGAEPAAAMARRQLRELGVRSIPRGPQATTRQNPAGLTQRQVDVLSLLADGLTNAEIAGRLVVSVRTVDHHVSALLAKLEVGSRREAADAARALGLAAGGGVADRV